MRLLARLVAWVGGVLLALVLLAVLSIWGLGTRGVPLTIDLAVKLLEGQLQVVRAEGGWFGPVVLEGLVFDSPAAHVEIDRLRLTWSPRALWSARTFQVDSLDIGTLAVTLKPQPPSAPEPLSTRLPRDLVVGDLRLAHFHLQPVEGEPVQLDAISTQASWRDEQVTLDRLELTHAHAGPVRARAVVQLAPKAITVQSLLLEGPAQLTAQGRLGLMGEPSDLSASLKEARWPLQGAAQFHVPALEATARGVLVGAPLDAALTLKGALRAAMQEQDFGFDIDGALQLQAQGAVIEKLAVVSTDGAGSLKAQGRAEWQPALRVDAVMQVEKLDPGVLLADWKGQLNGRVEASTTAAEGGDIPEVRFTAALDRSTLRGYPLKLDVCGLAAVQGDAQRVEIDTLTLVSGGTRLTGQGKLLPLLDARASLDAKDLKTLLPALAGAAQLSASAQGPPANPAVQAKGSLSQFRFDTVRVAAAEIDLAYDPAQDSRALVTASGIAVGETQISTASLTAEGRTERHTLMLKASLPEPKTDLAVTLAGAANLEAQSWRGSLQSSSFTPPYGPAWQQEAPGTLALAAKQQALAPTCWRAGAARLCLDATLAAPLTRIAYRIEQLDTAAFAALLPKDWLLQTIINGSGEVALNGTAPTALGLDLTLAAGRIAIPGAPELRLLPSSLAVRQQEAQWQAKGNLAVDRGTLVFEAALPVEGAALVERPLSGRVQLAVPELGWATGLVPGVTDLRGALEGAFTLAGSIAAPRLEGGIELSNGSARINAAGITVKEVTASVRGGNTGALQLAASATSGGGVLKLDGTADFASGKPVVKLTVKGQDVQVADIADARVWASPDLVYAQDAEGMKLSGTVTVPKADITPRNLAANAVGASRDQVLVGEDAPAAKPLPLSAEVTLILGEKVTFEGFGLKSRIEGRVTAIDVPGGGGTRGRGELRLREAAYKAYGQEIQVETGRILFNGGPIAEPTVDIIARRSPTEEVTVSLRVRGTLDQPTFDLSSTPVMPREQQLGWLLFGRPIDGGGGQLSGAAAALSLGIAGGDALASRIGNIIGLDQVSLGSDTSANAWQSSNTAPGVPGTDSTRFTVGKYLSPKLFVSYGVGLFDNGNVLRLLYDLGRGFKLRTEAGLETGGDLLYSVER